MFNRPLRTIRGLSICFLINVCGFVFALPFIASAFYTITPISEIVDLTIRLSFFLMILTLLISGSLTFIYTEDVS